MKKQTVTIGIPAYNEQKSIARVLDALLLQTEKGYILNEIIVVSDGSTDDTDHIVKSYTDSRIRLIKHTKRQGKNASLNTIFRQTKSKLLVIVDADVFIKKTHVISKLAFTSETQKSDLIAGNVIPLPATTRVEKAINNFVTSLTQVKNTLNKGNNIYSMRGPLYALSHTLFSNLKLPKNVPDDRYLYLYAKQNNMKFTFCKTATVYFRSPQTIADQMLQGKRFLIDKKNLYQKFSSSYIDSEYQLNKRMKFTILFNQVRTDLVSYLYLKLIHFVVQLFPERKDQTFWQKVSSTK